MNIIRFQVAAKTTILFIFSIIFLSCTQYEDIDMTFTDVTASQAIIQMGNGWNLGNTMEAVGTDEWPGPGAVATDYERLWGMPTTTKAMMKGLKNAGFNSVRIPVAWSNGMQNDGKYTINPTYFERVEEIVQYVLAYDMYAIINIHWDNGWWSGFKTQDTRQETMRRYTVMWSQIAEYFKDYPEKLIFESANEELGGESGTNDDERYQTVNEINQTFVDLVRSSGGNNAQRLLLIAGYNTDVNATCDNRFQMPKDTIKDHQMVSVHYYTPSPFCILAEDADWAKCDYEWGTQDDYDEMRKQFEKMKKFSSAGYPVVIGEYGVAKANGQVKQGTKEFFKSVVDLSKEMGYCSMLWDCNDWYNRNRRTFNDPEIGRVFE